MQKTYCVKKDINQKRQRSLHRFSLGITAALVETISHYFYEMKYHIIFQEMTYLFI